MARHPRLSPLLAGQTPNLTHGGNEPLPKTTAIRILPTQNPGGSQDSVSNDHKVSPHPSSRSLLVNLLLFVCASSLVNLPAR